MATCGYSRSVSGQCGSSRDYPNDLSCLTIKNCQQKIEGHFNHLLTVFDCQEMKEYNKTIKYENQDLSK